MVRLPFFFILSPKFCSRILFTLYSFGSYNNQILFLDIAFNAETISGFSNFFNLSQEITIH